MAPSALDDGLPPPPAALHLSLCAPAPYPLPAPSPHFQVFNVWTLAVKFLSCGLAVSSGLPVGPEGPLIHIGAALGSAISQGHSTTMG